MLQIRRRLFGDEYIGTLQSIHSISHLLYDQGRFIEARDMLRDTQDFRIRTLGEEHLLTLQGENGLAMIISKLGKLDDGTHRIALAAPFGN